METRRTYLTMAAIALAASSLTAAAPAIAHGVEHALFAHEADKVDGKHAVGAGASRQERANKLVAADRTGHLPNDIVRGTRVVATRRVAPNGEVGATLLALPGLGRLVTTCADPGLVSSITWTNTTSQTVDVWYDNGSAIVATAVAPAGTAPVASYNTASGDHPSQGIELGYGNPTNGRTATVHAYVRRDASPGPCTFQARAVVWTAG